MGSDGFRLVQMVVISGYEFRWVQMCSDGSRWVQMDSDWLDVCDGL